MMRFITPTALTACLAFLPLPAFSATGNNNPVPLAAIELVPVIQEPATFATTCSEISAILTPYGAMAVEAHLTLHDSAEPGQIVVTASQSSFHLEIDPADTPDIIRGFTEGNGWLVVMPLSPSDAAAAYTPTPVGKHAIFVAAYDGESTPQGCIQLSGFQPVLPEDLPGLPPTVADTLTRTLNQAHK